MHSARLVLVDRAGVIRAYHLATDARSMGRLHANLRQLLAAETRRRREPDERPSHGRLLVLIVLGSPVPMPRRNRGVGAPAAVPRPSSRCAGPVTPSSPASS